jgi:hypothetical protein
MYIKHLKFYWLLALLLAISSASAQNQSLFSIANHNPKSNVVHMEVMEGNLYSILPVFKDNNTQSGYKIYKSNASNIITDSLVVEYPLMQTYVTNFVKESTSTLKFGISLTGLVNGFHQTIGFRIFKINSSLIILDSLDIIDENFSANNFTFGNLINGPQNEFLLNVIFNRVDKDGSLSYNVYYNIDDAFRFRKKYADSSHFAHSVYTSSLTTNILYYKGNYVMVKTTDGMGPSSKIIRLSRNLDLVFDSIIYYGSVFKNLFHAPLIVNQKWIIGGKITNQKMNAFPNFMEVTDDNRILPKSNFNGIDINGSDYVSNYGSFYDSINLQLHLLYNELPFGRIHHFCYDTAYKLLWSKRYEFPVNKIDTIYTMLAPNGTLMFNNKIYIYGFKQEKTWLQNIGPLKPFIVTTDQLDLVTGIEHVKEKLNYPVIFPNPCKDKIYLNDTKVVYSISIYNQIGQLVLHANFDSDYKVEVDKLNLGLYFYKVSDANGFVLSGKLVKE